MKIKFEVLGDPKGKQRPRMCRIDGKTITYTPKQTKEYEKKIKACYKAVSKTFFDKNIPVKINIQTYFAIPKNISNKLKNKFSSGEFLPTKPPDVDNCAKVICDALNGVAFFDDRQICKLTIEKYYAAIPKIVVELEALEVFGVPTKRSFEGEKEQPRSEQVFANSKSRTKGDATQWLRISKFTKMKI